MALSLVGGVISAGSSPRWCMSRKTYRFVRDTRVGTDCRTAVRPRHAAHGACPRRHPGRGHALGATQKAANHKPGEVHKCQHLAIRRASARRWKKRWSDRGLQVIDLKAAGALSCPYVIGAHCIGSQRIILAQRCMHHAPTRGCCRASLAVGE